MTCEYQEMIETEIKHLEVELAEYSLKADDIIEEITRLEKELGMLFD